MRASRLESAAASMTSRRAAGGARLGVVVAGGLLDLQETLDGLDRADYFQGFRLPLVGRLMSEGPAHAPHPDRLVPVPQVEDPSLEELPLPLAYRHVRRRRASHPGTVHRRAENVIGVQVVELLGPGHPVTPRHVAFYIPVGHDDPR